MSDRYPTDEHDRRQPIDAAVANARIEGIGPTPETMAILDRFVIGEIDGGEMLRLIGAGTLSTGDL